MRYGHRYDTPDLGFGLRVQKEAHNGIPRELACIGVLVLATHTHTLQMMIHIVYIH